MRLFVSLLVAPLVLAGCSNADEPAPVDDAAAAPQPEFTSAPVATAAPDGSALVTGEWSVTESGTGAQAAFGVADSAPVLSFTCDTATRVVTLMLASAAAGPEAWRLDAGGEAARIDMAPGTSALPELTARIEPTLAIFHAFSTPGAVVALTSPAGERMQFPTHPGISRVLYACS